MGNVLEGTPCGIGRTKPVSVSGADYFFTHPSAPTSPNSGLTAILSAEVARLIAENKQLSELVVILNEEAEELGRKNSSLKAESLALRAELDRAEERSATPFLLRRGGANNGSRMEAWDVCEMNTSIPQSPQSPTY